MKLLLRVVEKIRPHFEEGGKFHAFLPVYDAIEHFLFAPGTITTTAPHVRDPIDLKRFMSMVIVALLPCVATGIYFFGLRFIALIVVSYAAGLSVEALFSIVRKEPINEGFFVTGFLFPLIMPPAVPLWMVALGVAFGVVIGKELFGGTGRNLFNPALVGRCFLALAYPVQMSGSWLKPGAGVAGRLLQYVDGSNVDAVTSATPLALAKGGEYVSLSHMFVGSVSGSVGETSALAILAGGMFLLLTRVANWRTVASILISFTALAAMLHHAQPDRFGPALWHLCAGGLLFGAFFMATDPVTGPITSGGKWLYGALIGVVTVLIRNFTGYVEGVTFAILLGNIFAPILDEMVFALRLRRLKVEG
ncbi:MAG: RnfABCDGE type electron transport complex subunit D [Sedimentisphaerales bacterium]|nr:RnfABCDGE type electron transport complex subunit D [Sedimentisphaerales bacterium]